MANPRYTKQYDHYSCGPVAFINTLKWAGQRLSLRKDLRRIQRAVKCRRNKGTWSHNMHTAMGKLFPKAGIKFRWDKNPDFRSIRAHLRAGGAVLVRYMWGQRCKDSGKWEQSGHFFLITGLTEGGKFYKTVNMLKTSKALYLRSSHRMMKDINQYRDYLSCWYLTKS